MSVLLTGIAIGVLAPMIPTLIAFVLPRQKTIGYGRFLFNVGNKLLLQKGESLIKNKQAADQTVHALETSLVDIAFGIYIESRNLTEDEKTNRINTYIKE